MSYEIFQKGAAVNSEFEVIPSKMKLLAEGIVTDKNGYINFEGETYITNMVKLANLPKKLQYLFVEDHTKLAKYDEDIETKKPPKKENSQLEDLSKTLFEQLQNIVDPEKGTDMNLELKKANAVCNVSDKLIKIADLSLKAKKFNDQKLIGSKRNIYEC